MKKVIVLRKFKFNNKNRRPIKKKNDLNAFFNNSNFLYATAVSVFSVISVLLGSVIYLKSPIIDFNSLIEKYIYIFQTSSFTVIFKNLILLESLFTVPCILFSTNLFGCFFINLVPVAKAMFSGYCIAFMYNQYELNGVLFSLIFLVPYLSITCTAAIAMAYEGYRCSKSVTGTVIQKRTAKDDNLQLYFVRFIILLLIELTVITLNSFLIKSFAMKIILQ